jgi:hypothetical protein
LKCLLQRRYHVVCFWRLWIQFSLFEAAVTWCIQ